MTFRVYYPLTVCCSSCYGNTSTRKPLKSKMSNSIGISGDLRKVQEDLNALKGEHEYILKRLINFMKEKDLSSLPLKSGINPHGLPEELVCTKYNNQRSIL